MLGLADQAFLDVLGVKEAADLAWLQPRLTPHPWLAYTEPVSLGAAEASVPGAYVECPCWMRVFEPYAGRARALGWQIHELATGHEAMVTAPDDLTHDVARTWVIHPVACRTQPYQPKHAS